MNKNTKLLVLVLSLALMIGAVVGITAQAAESDPVILSQNVEYGGNYALMYAIKADSVKADEVTLAVYANAECTGEPLWDKTVKATAENQETVKGTACYVFTTAGIAAKDMDVQYYVKVTAGEGETVKRYSVAEYLYERLYKNGVAFSKEEGNVKRAELYNTVLLYGKQAQDVLCNYNNKTEDDRTTFVTDMKYVFVADGAGTVDGTFESGIFLSGSEVALKPSASIAGWTLYNAETGEAIKSIGANEPFTVDCHVKAAVTLSNRGSGKYANYKDTINYTNATLESLMASKDITTNTGSNGTLKSTKKVTFEDSSLVFTSTGSSWGSIDFWGHNFANGSSATTADSFVFETDLYIATDSEITSGRASSFLASSKTGTGDGWVALVSIYADPASNGYILTSYNSSITTVVPYAEWINIRFEAMNVASGSVTYFYINNELVATSTLATSLGGTNGVQFRHASNSGGNGFSSGVMKLDNTYCGVIPFLGATGTGAYASEALNYTGKTYADLTASGDITVAKNGATNSVVNVDSNDILKVNYKANGTWGRYSFKNSGEVTEGYVFETDICFNDISVPAGRSFYAYGTANLAADAEAKYNVFGFALVKNTDDGSYYIRLNTTKTVAYTITEGEWINVRVEADALSNSTVRLYVNGVLVDSYNFSSDISAMEGIQLMFSSTYNGTEGFTGNVLIDNTYVGAKK